MVPDEDAQCPPAPPDGAPDLECAVCFSQFDNVFRTPKMLHCKHTFCLECLARMNIKASEPNAILCPLCRGVTPLPDLGLPKLENNPTILSYLPMAMQRVYSVRFNRTRGKLQVKGPCTVSHSLDVGLPGPTPTPTPGPGPRPRLGRMQQLSNRPLCRALILISAALLLALLICIIIILLRSRD
ncbi:RING finger protein 223 isoform X2 [Conger conger]|nr:RING finger protein 223 isoform X2 [Conger conger]XP_061117534.1 RING finger protein 223 isoform X2 [Conger conger]XP_061117535.1 RING finger protein 223 isoform X2 [Conger conger]XP_061117536.1 RING finger protein 223 isoform X2 [Conger conger]